MDLKIKDVAELLNVSETTIRRWLVEGKIPAYRINHQFRFSRTEIEDWLMSCKMDSKLPQEIDSKVLLQSTKMKKIVKRAGTRQFSLYRALHHGDVLDEIDGVTKEEVIRNTVAKIACKLNADAEVLIELLLDREKLMPTSLNYGIAVPHTRDFYINEPYDMIITVYPKKPVDYGALDNKFVHTLFFLFACEDKRHLNLLAKLAHFVSDEETRKYLEKRPDKGMLLKNVKDFETKIPNLATS
jgi:nitrogen PTS system EIIA component